MSVKFKNLLISVMKNMSTRVSNASSLESSDISKLILNGITTA